MLHSITKYRSTSGKAQTYILNAIQEPHPPYPTLYEEAVIAKTVVLFSQTFGQGKQLGIINPLVVVAHVPIVALLDVAPIAKVLAQPALYGRS